MDISLTLPPDILDIVRKQVESGRYASTSEVVREALLLMQRFDKLETDRLETLRSAWRAGVDSGDAGPLDMAELRAEAQRALEARTR